MSGICPTLDTVTFNPQCRACRRALQVGVSALAAVAFTMPLFAARETGWLTEDPPREPHRPDPTLNLGIGASAAMPGPGQDVYGGYLVLRQDVIPDR